MATPESRSGNRSLTLAFAGDIHFQSHLRPLLDEPESALAPIRPELSEADLTIANLETAVTTRGEPEDKQFTFRTSPRAFDALAAAGVDVVSMANNHGVDYGSVGLADTLAAAEHAPVAVVGIGADAEQAFAPHVATIRGTRVAVIGADQVRIRRRPTSRLNASTAALPRHSTRSDSSRRYARPAVRPTSWWSTCTGAASW